MTKSVLSRETPHYPLPILQERFSLGGGGNVAANIKSLGVSRLSFVTCVGTDWRERIFRDFMEQQEISYADVLQSAKRVTPAYCKPLRHGIADVVYEDPRLDFSNYAPLCRMDEDRFLERLHAAADSSDVLAVSDQLEFGCITPRIRDALCAIARSMPVVVDSRERIGLYRHAIIKPNEVECRPNHPRPCIIGRSGTASAANCKTAERAYLPECSPYIGRPRRGLDSGKNRFSDSGSAGVRAG